MLKSVRGLFDREVNKHGRAGWQGNVFSSEETCRGRIDREVNKKMLTFAPPLNMYLDTVGAWLIVPWASSLFYS